MSSTKHDKRQIILDTSLLLVAERGLHNTPMSLISKESKVSIGAIYNYFENKEILINTLYLQLKQSMSSVYTQEVEGSYEEKFIALWLNFYTYFEKNLSVISFLEQCANSPIITDETKKAITYAHQPSIAIIQEGIDLGILKQIQASFAQDLIYGMIVMAIRSQLDVEQAKIIAKICFDGLKA